MHIQQMHDTANRLRHDAGQSSDAIYCAKMLKAADDLETRAIELEHQRHKGRVH